MNRLALGVLVLGLSTAVAQEDVEEVMDLGSFDRDDQTILVFQSSDGYVISVDESENTIVYRDMTLQEVAETEGGAAVEEAFQERGLLRDSMHKARWKAANAAAQARRKAEEAAAQARRKAEEAAERAREAAEEAAERLPKVKTREIPKEP